jgi:hypothetical protein
LRAISSLSFYIISSIYIKAFFFPYIYKAASRLGISILPGIYSHKILLSCQNKLPVCLGCNSLVFRTLTFNSQIFISLIIFILFRGFKKPFCRMYVSCFITESKINSDSFKISKKTRKLLNLKKIIYLLDFSITKYKEISFVSVFYINISQFEKSFS